MPTNTASSPKAHSGWPVFNSKGFFGGFHKPASKAFSQLIAGLHHAMLTPPYFAIVEGLSQENDRGHAEDILAALALVGAPTRTPPKISFTRVAISDTAEANAENKDWTAYSRTAQGLGLHTDSSYLVTPHHFIAFQMITPDPTGGDTLITTADMIEAAIPKALRDQLIDTYVPFGDVELPILSDNPAKPHIRYYGTQIEKALLEKDNSDARALMHAVDTLLCRTLTPIRFRLEPGQMLVINNWRVLHGRTELAPNSQRVMLRYRLYHGSWT